MPTLLGSKDLIQLYQQIINLEGGMDFEKQKGRSFFGVSMFIILAGVTIFTIGVVAWILNCNYNATVVTVPSIKVIGGLMVMSLGYILMVLEAIRKK